MNLLAHRIAVLVSARPLRRLRISSGGPECWLVSAGMPRWGAGFVRARKRQRLKRLGPVKSLKNGIAPSICRRVVAACTKRTTVPRRAASDATFHVIDVACGNREVVS
jgi:hypothetical protein